MNRVLPPILFLLFALAMGLICWGAGLTHHVPYPWNLLGAPLLAGGLGLAQGSKRLFRQRRTNVNTFAKPDILVTDGIFRYTRNPMYLGFAIAMAGLAILYQGGLSSFALVALFVLITDRWYIRYEERMLLDAFGAAYRRYRDTTRRWL